MSQKSIVVLVGMALLFQPQFEASCLAETLNAGVTPGVSSAATEVSSVQPRQETFVPHATWWCDCDEKPAIMQFDNAGTVTLSGSFAWISPSRWEYLADAKKLKLILPEQAAERAKSFFEASDKNMKQQNKTPFTEYNAETRELTFPFDDQTPSIELFGWYFYKEEK